MSSPCPATAPSSVREKARGVNIPGRNVLLEYKRRCNSVDRLLHAFRIDSTQCYVRLARKLRNLSRLTNRDIDVNLAMVLMHDFSGLLRVGHGAFQPVKRRSDEA